MEIVSYPFTVTWSKLVMCFQSSFYGMEFDVSHGLSVCSSLRIILSSRTGSSTIPTDCCTDITSRAVLSRMSVELRSSLRDVVRRVNGGGSCISIFTFAYSRIICVVLSLSASGIGRLFPWPCIHRIPEFYRILNCCSVCLWQSSLEV